MRERVRAPPDPDHMSRRQVIERTVVTLLDPEAEAVEQLGEGGHPPRCHGHAPVENDGGPGPQRVERRAGHDHTATSWATGSPRLFAIGTRPKSTSRSWPERRRSSAKAGRTARPSPSSTFKTTPTPSGEHAQKRPSAPTFAIQPGRARINIVSGECGPRISTGCSRI